ncbi:hypothetical protein Vretimale_16055, partial [Volvox reticuliferus]
SRQSHPEGPYVSPTAGGSAAKADAVVTGGGTATPSAAIAAAPAGAAGYLSTSPGWPSYGTAMPYPAVPIGLSSDVSFFPGLASREEIGAVGGGEGTVAELAAPPVGAAAAMAAAAWEAVASAAVAPDGTTRLATRVVTAARAVGEAVVAAAHSLAYDIRRRVRTAPTENG